MASRRSPARLVGSLVGVAGVAFSMTLVYRGMRSVMAIGGTCASGNQPFQVAHQCPKGVGWLLPVGIFGGLLFLGLFAACTTDAGRSLLLFAWPALFLSLGWNFADYGFHITTRSSLSTGSADVGFIVCAVVFIIMGAVPLIWLLPRLWQVITRGDPEEVEGSAGRAPLGGFATSGGFGTSVQFNSPSAPSTPSWRTNMQASPPATAAPPPTAPTATAPTTTTRSRDLAGELERLASLHRRKELSDAEYEAAKQRAIDGNPT